MTKEEILKKHEDVSKGHLNGWQKEWVFNAMQEYADQQTKELQQRVEQLQFELNAADSDYASKEKELLQIIENLKNTIKINKKLIKMRSFRKI